MNKDLFKGEGYPKLVTAVADLSRYVSDVREQAREVYDNPNKDLEDLLEALEEVEYIVKHMMVNVKFEMEQRENG